MSNNKQSIEAEDKFHDIINVVTRKTDHYVPDIINFITGPYTS